MRLNKSLKIQVNIVEVKSFDMKPVADCQSDHNTGAIGLYLTDNIISPILSKRPSYDDPGKISKI